MTDVHKTQEQNGKSSCWTSLGQDLEDLESLYPSMLEVSVRNEPLKSGKTLFLRASDLDFTMVCFLSEQYPQVVPHVTLRTHGLARRKMKEIERIVSVKASQLTGQPMLCALVQEVQYFMECHMRQSGKKRSKEQRKLEKRCDNFDDSGNDDDGDEDQREHSPHPLAGDYELLHDSGSLTLSENVTEHAEGGDKMPRPNFFLAVRIWNEDIMSSLSQVQQHLAKREPLLNQGVIPSEAFHVTLCNLGLDTPLSLTLAIETLRKLKPQLERVLPKQPLVIHSMSQFYNRAIYAKVQCEDLFLFHQTLSEGLTNAGVEIRDDHANYNPHLTVIKVRRPERKLFGSRNIQPDIYRDWLNVTFGEQPLDALYLCAMGGAKRQDGFYVTPFEMQF